MRYINDLLEIVLVLSNNSCSKHKMSSWRIKIEGWLIFHNIVLQGQDLEQRNLELFVYCDTCARNTTEERYILKIDLITMDDFELEHSFFDKYSMCSQCNCRLLQIEELENIAIGIWDLEEEDE